MTQAISGTARANQADTRAGTERAGAEAARGDATGFAAMLAGWSWVAPDGGTRPGPEQEKKAEQRAAPERREVAVRAVGEKGIVKGVIARGGAAASVAQAAAQELASSTAGETPGAESKAEGGERVSGRVTRADVGPGERGEVSAERGEPKPSGREPASEAGARAPMERAAKAESPGAAPTTEAGKAQAAPAASGPVDGRRAGLAGVPASQASAPAGAGAMKGAQKAPDPLAPLAGLGRAGGRTIGRESAARAATSGAVRSPEQVVEQALRGLNAAVRQKGGVVTMRLAPEALGELKVRLELGGDRVVARFEVGTESARELLERGKETLRGALEARGLSVERIEIIGPSRAGAERVPGEDAPREQGSGWSGDSGDSGGLAERGGTGERGFAGDGDADQLGELGGEALAIDVDVSPGVWIEDQDGRLARRVDAIG